MNPKIDVYGEPSERLAALVEAGDLTSPDIDTEVGRHVSNLIDTHPVRDTILGCTHYPIVDKVLQRKAPHVAFINPAYDQAGTVLNHLAERELLLPGNHDTVGTLETHTSGTSPVYKTVLGELGVSHEYTLNTVDFQNA